MSEERGFRSQNNRLQNKPLIWDNTSIPRKSRIETSGCILYNTNTIHTSSVWCIMNQFAKNIHGMLIINVSIKQNAVAAAQYGTWWQRIYSTGYVNLSVIVLSDDISKIGCEWGSKMGCNIYICISRTGKNIKWLTRLILTANLLPPITLAPPKKEEE